MAREALMRFETCVNSLRQELFSSKYEWDKSIYGNLTLSLSRIALPRDALVSLRDFTTDANNQRVCWGNSLITVDIRCAKTL
jgi:hypothetical protein